MVSYSTMLMQRPKQIPTSPGVYFFKGQKGRVLYVGKAANLKNRLSSYFNKQTKEPRIQKMLDEASDIIWQEVDSEIEALLLEAEKIREYQPSYNIVFRDDKQYGYVVFTDDVFPKIYITHQPQDDQAVIGPFVDVGALRTTLKLFRRVFPYCTCKQPHNNYCLSYHIGQCLGFCCLKSPTVAEEQIEEYKENIKSIKQLLRGGKKLLINEMEKEMKQHGKEEGFEKAIKLRDRLEKIKAVFENARIIREISRRGDALSQIQKVFNLPELPTRIEGYDIANIQGKFATGSMVVFTNGNPDKNEYKKFRIRSDNTPDDTRMLQEVLRRRFNHPEWQYPDLILIDGGKGQLNAVKTAISNSEFLISKKFPIIALTKNNKHKGDHVFASNSKTPTSLTKLPKPVSDLILQIDDEAHRFAIEYYRKLHRKNI